MPSIGLARLPILRDLRNLGLDAKPPEMGVPGDPGLYGPGSEVWRVGRERVLLAGGAAALLLQLAHPLVAAGVADHSSFRRDPFQRLRATLDAVLAISFGDREQARRAAAAVSATHRRVRGVLADPVGPYPVGTPYRATDPGLALWVHATLVFAALESYSSLVEPLGLGRRERYYQEAKRFARLFGVTDEVLPAGYADFQEYWRSMVAGPDLAAGPVARELAAAVLRPPVTAVLTPALSPLRTFTAGLLPERIRREFGFAAGEPRRSTLSLIRGTIQLGVRVAPRSVRYWPHYRVALERMAATASGNNRGDRAGLFRAR
jgi:uncharacterized protein (DUF2236 family)